MRIWTVWDPHTNLDENQMNVVYYYKQFGWKYEWLYMEMSGVWMII